MEYTRRRQNDVTAQGSPMPCATHSAVSHARWLQHCVLSPHLGFGRIVVSENRVTESLSKSGMEWISGSTKRQCDRTLGGAPPERVAVVRVDRRLPVRVVGADVARGGHLGLAADPALLERGRRQVGPKAASWPVRSRFKRLERAQLLGQLLASFSPGARARPRPPWTGRSSPSWP